MGETVNSFNLFSSDQDYTLCQWFLNPLSNKPLFKNCLRTTERSSILDTYINHDHMLSLLTTMNISNRVVDLLGVL